MTTSLSLSSFQFLHFLLLPSTTFRIPSRIGKLFLFLFQLILNTLSFCFTIYLTICVLCVLYSIVVTWSYVCKYCIKYVTWNYMHYITLKTVPQSEGAVNFIEKRKIDVRGGS